MPLAGPGGRLTPMIRKRSSSTYSHATRTPARRRWVTAVPLLALACAGCGGGSQAGVATKTMPAKQWVAAACDSFQRYDGATKHPLLEFQGLHLEFQYGEPKQGEVRDKQTAASEEIVKATDRLIADLNAAGAPATAHGRAFADAVVAAFQELRDSVNHVQRSKSSGTRWSRAPRVMQISSAGTYWFSSGLTTCSRRWAHDRGLREFRPSRPSGYFSAAIAAKWSRPRRAVVTWRA